MAIDPAYWLFEKVASKLGDSLSERGLDKELRQTVVKWKKELPKDLQLIPEAIFSKNEDLDYSEQPALKSLRSILQEDGIPPSNLWVDALMERLELTIEQPEVFGLKGSVVRYHIEKLASRLERVCWKDEDRFRVNVARLLQHQQDEISKFNNASKRNETLSPTSTVIVPKEFRTPVKQYLAFFDEFMVMTKGYEINLEVYTTVNGLELEIRKPIDADLDLINTKLKEYFDFVRQDIDQINIKFEVAKDNITKQQFLIELRCQVNNLRDTLGRLVAPPKMIEEPKVNTLSSSVSKPKESVNLSYSSTDESLVMERELEIKKLKYKLVKERKYKKKLEKWLDKALNMQFHFHSNANANANAYAKATVNFSLELTKLQDALDSLRDDLETPALKEAQDLLDKIPQDADKDKLVEAGVMPKLKRLVEKGLDAETKFGKAVKAAESGINNLQKVGRIYNTIAQNVGLSSIPTFLLGKSVKTKE